AQLPILPVLCSFDPSYVVSHSPSDQDSGARSPSGTNFAVLLVHYRQLHGLSSAFSLWSVCIYHSYSANLPMNANLDSVPVNYRHNLLGYEAPSIKLRFHGSIGSNQKD